MSKKVEPRADCGGLHGVHGSQDAIQNGEYNNKLTLQRQTSKTTLPTYLCVRVLHGYRLSVSALKCTFVGSSHSGVHIVCTSLSWCFILLFKWLFNLRSLITLVSIALKM